MYTIRKKDGTLAKDYREILNVQYEYYKNLCAPNEQVKFTQENRSGVQISDSQKEEFEKFVSKEELFDAVMTLHSGHCQGLDGLSVEFYRQFWKQLVDPLYEVLVMAFNNGRLSALARRGVISLIPKKLTDCLSIDQWRGITLLCTDYKIFAKALVN